jgi:hypothetical protein
MPLNVGANTEAQQASDVATPEQEPLIMQIVARKDLLEVPLLHIASEYMRHLH